MPDLPVLAQTDILVVGAGASGVAAATIAAEAGKRVMLIERYGFCGGAAVAGMSGTICGLYSASDAREKPRQIIFGFAERFRKAIADRGGLTSAQIYGKTRTVTHDPLMWRETADTFLEASGVRVLFHCLVTGAIVTGDAFKGVVVESKAGRSCILAERIIDASGDAAVIARGGYACTFGDGGRIQNPTMLFRLGNVNMTEFAAYYGADTICPPQLAAALRTAHASGGYNLPRNKIWVFQTTRPHELLVNATRLSGRDGHMLNVVDPVDFTEAEVLGRQQVREYARFFADHVPGCEASYVVDTGVEAGVRQTRSIVGAEQLRNDDVVVCRKRADGICRVSWPIELHSSGAPPKLHWLVDDYYEVPFLALVPAVGENIIVAGRCLSAEHEALASARVTAPCFEYGHAAAVAAALSIDRCMPLREIPVKDIRSAMTTQGSAL